MSGTVIPGAAGTTGAALRSAGIISPGLVPAGMRTSAIYGGSALSDGVATNGNTCLRHIVCTPGNGLQLAFQNFNNWGINAGQGSVTLNASLEIGSVIVPLTFAGQLSVTLAAGAQVISDPVSLVVSVGDIVYSHTHYTVTAGQKWPQLFATYNGYGESSYADTTTNDYTNVAHRDLFGTFGGNVFGPLALLTQRTTGAPFVVGLGDSIMSGTNNPSPPAPFGLYNGSWMNLAVEGQLPFMNLGNYGELLSYVAPATFGGQPPARWMTQRAPLAAAADYAVCDYASNDFAAGATLATVQGLLINFAAYLAGQGVNLYWSTCLPRPTTSDAGATTGGFTLPTWEAIRLAWNVWLRAGAPMIPATGIGFAPVAAGTAGALVAGQPGHPLAGIIDTAVTVESTITAGAWKVPGWTTDGGHPNAIAETAMAAAVPVTKFPSTTALTIAVRKATPAAVLPSALTGLAHWFQPSTLGAGGSTIATWPDSSGAGNTATATSPAPTVAAGVANGLSAVQFAAGNKPLAAGPAGLALPIYGAMVVSQPVAAVGGLLSSPNGSISLELSNSGGWVTWLDGTSVGWANLAGTGFHVIEFIIGTGSDEVRIDGQLVATGTHAVATIAGWYIGATNAGGGNVLIGYIAEFFDATAIPVPGQRHGIRQGLGTKYAIPVQV